MVRLQLPRSSLPYSLLLVGLSITSTPCGASCAHGLALGRVLQLMILHRTLTYGGSGDNPLLHEATKQQHSSQQTGRAPLASPPDALQWALL
jgi:hypothetical protein